MAMRFRVINRFALRDSKGEVTGEYAMPGAEVEVNGSDAERLIRANCIVPLKEIEVERMVREAPENQMKRGRRK